MRDVVTLLLLVLGTASPAVAQVPDSVELAFAGDLLRLRSVPQTGGQWFAVARTANGVALIQTRIDVKQVPDPCGVTGTRIVASEVVEPLFLVRGSRFFRAGPLDTAFSGMRFIYPAEGLSMRIGSGAWFRFEAFGAARPAPANTSVTDYQIRLRQGSQIQILAEFAGIDWDGPPQLMWAGDLDRDGRLDALLDLRTSYAGHRYVLFLSTGAPAGQLVRKAAEFPISGC